MTSQGFIISHYTQFADGLQSLEDAKAILGEVSSISSLFINFQKHLYNNLRA